MASLIEAHHWALIQSGDDPFANCSVEESSVRVTSQPIQVLRPTFGRSNLAALLLVAWVGLSPNPVAASPFLPQIQGISILQIETWMFGQPPRPGKPKPNAPKKEGPIEFPELKRDKEALPEGFRISPVAIPEIAIIKELPVPNKNDKNEMKTHNKKLGEYSRILYKGLFGDEKAERELLRYGITFRLNEMTQKSVLYPSDEERAKIVDPELVGKPKAPDSLTTLRDKLLTDLRNTNNSARNFQIRDAFLDILVEEAAKLLDNNIYVRYQVGYILSVINNRDEEKGFPEEPCFRATKVLLSIVNDDKQQFGNKINPVRGLARICRHKNCKTEDRFLIIETLIKQMQAAKTLHWWYGEAVAESLSNLGDPLDRAKNPAVAEALFAVLKDPAYADRVRATAAYALARIPLETFKRADEIAIENLRLGYDLAQAYEKDPLSAHWRRDFMLLYLAFKPENQSEVTELKGLLIQVEKKGVFAGARSVVTDAYQHLLPLVQNVMGVKGVTPIPDQLRKIKTWLDSKANKNGGAPVAEAAKTVSP